MKQKLVKVDHEKYHQMLMGLSGTKLCKEFVNGTVAPNTGSKKGNIYVKANILHEVEAHLEQQESKTYPSMEELFPSKEELLFQSLGIVVDKLRPENEKPEDIDSVLESGERLLVPIVNVPEEYLRKARERPEEENASN